MSNTKIYKIMKLFSKKEISEKLNISVRTVDRLLKRRELEALRIGRLIRVTQDQLDQFLEKSALNHDDKVNFPTETDTNI
jgi:excisionase family DNA binding protein